MKKSLTVLALLAGAYAVHAQGTVSLGNYVSAAHYIYVSYKPVSGPNVLLGGANVALGSYGGATMANYASLTANGNDWTVQLYGAPGYNNSAALAPLFQANGTSLAQTTFAITPGGYADYDSYAGTWNTSVYGVIPGMASGLAGPATVQLAAWYNDGGTITTLATAESDGVPWGQSVVANLSSTGGPNPVSGQPAITPQDVPTGSGGIGNFVVQVPEPSTIALGVIGTSAFLMRLRRKS